jgi:hypothetical protein
MKFSLIIRAYMQPKPLLQLLQSVAEQTLYPDEIAIDDGAGRSNKINFIKMLVWNDR